MDLRLHHFIPAPWEATVQRDDQLSGVGATNNHSGSVVF